MIIEFSLSLKMYKCINCILCPAFIYFFYECQRVSKLMFALPECLGKELSCPLSNNDSHHFQFLGCHHYLF